MAAKKKTSKKAPKKAKESPESVPEREVSAAAQTAQTPADRIDVCEELMITGKWAGRTTHRTLANLWGVGLGRVRQYSAEASRRIRKDVSPEERAERRSMALGYLDRVKQLAVSGQGRKDLSAGISAVKLEGQICGFVVEKHEIQTTTGPFEGWTVEELDHYEQTGESPARFRQEL